MSKIKIEPIFKCNRCNKCNISFESKQMCSYPRSNCEAKKVGIKITNITHINTKGKPFVPK